MAGDTPSTVPLRTSEGERFDWWVGINQTDRIDAALDRADIFLRVGQLIAWGIEDAAAHDRGGEDDEGFLSTVLLAARTCQNRVIELHNATVPTEAEAVDDTQAVAPQSEGVIAVAGRQRRRRNAGKAEITLESRGE